MVFNFLLGVNTDVDQFLRLIATSTHLPKSKCVNLSDTYPVYGKNSNDLRRNESRKVARNVCDAH